MRIMNKFSIIIMFLLVCCKIVFPQDAKQDLKNLAEKFGNFNYSEVIKEASKLIEDSDRFNDSQLIEIYRMQGISYFSLSNEQQARSSFTEILKIDSSYELNPINTSPKIISFFDKVRNLYLLNLEQNKEEAKTIIKHDTVYVEVPVTIKDTIDRENIRQALLRSVFIPGTGHLYLHSDFKAWALTTLSVASIAAGIYYIIDTNKKEREYLQETDINNIPGKYNDYNFSYRMRNFAIITYATLWLYSQFDILFFSNKENSTIVSYLPALNFKPNNSFSLNYRINF
jgi:tetratricopeptide (TPR) repeat protein